MKKNIEFWLRTSVAHRIFLIKMLDKGKHIYNLALSECKKRLNRLRADKEYQTLLALRRDLKKSKLKTTQVDKLLRDIVSKRYFLTSSDIEKYVKNHAGYIMDSFKSITYNIFRTFKRVMVHWNLVM